MTDDKVQATYLIETPHSLEHAATVIAGEGFVAARSSSPFPSITLDLRCPTSSLRWPQTYELQELSGIRLIDLELPAAFAARYPGPGFGVDGTRKLAQVHGRPLIGTIVKPSIGLSTSDLKGTTRTRSGPGNSEPAVATVAVHYASSRSGLGTIVDLTVFIAIASATAREIPGSENSNRVCISSQG